MPANDWPTHRGTLPASISQAKTRILEPVRPAPAAPVFVDGSGRRLLKFRLAMCAAALVALVFVSAVVYSVIAGHVSPTATASVPAVTTTTPTTTAQ